MYKRIAHWKFILIGIILLAAILRFWQLGQVPLGFHADEAAYGYNAYSFLLTGKDEYGKSYPFVLQSFGEYKPALYAYLTIPWIAIFDLNPFSVRFATALFGLLTVPLLYFFTNKLLANQKVALIATFLLAISPWHLNVSRTTTEVVVSVFFILLLMYAVFSLKEKFHLWWFVTAIISGIFAIHSYTASRFFVVLIVCLLTLLFTKIVNKKLSVNPKLLLLCGVFICIGFFTTFLDSANRFNQISILSTAETQLALEEQLREDQYTPRGITRIFHNKAINYTRTIGQNFAEYFTLDFFVFKGGFPERMMVINTGLFYFWQLPFLLLGLYILFRKKNSTSIFLIGWWILLLIPASLTYHEIPNVYRALVTLPPLLIIMAIGINKVFFETKLPKLLLQGIIGTLCIVGLFEMGYYLHQYYVHQELHHPWYRGYAYKPLITSLGELTKEYKNIIMTKSHGSPYIYLLFYSKYDPKTYQKQGSPRDLDYKGFDNYHFVPEHCFTGGKSKLKDGIATGSAILYVIRGECKIPKNFKTIQTVRWQDNVAAFQLVEYTGPNIRK